MNSYLLGVITYFEAVIHPARGKDAAKPKRRPAKPAMAIQASPDAMHLRTGAKASNSLRRNPAP